MNNTIEYDKISYKKYQFFCQKEREELIEKGADVDFQMLSFNDFVKRIEENSEFARIWGYWNFI
jgi:hypothetical protein